MTTATLMSQITTKPQEPPPRRTLFYGVYGVGKTSIAAKSPSPIFIPTEDGMSHIDAARFPLAENYAAVIQALAALYENDHNYKTVVVDSLDWLERHIWSEVTRERRVRHIEDIGYAKGYSYALDYWRRFLDGLTALRRAKRMAVVLLAHAKIETFSDPMTEPYSRYSPAIHKLAAALVQEWCDEILFACYRVHTRQIDGGFGLKKSLGIGDGERVMRTEERPSHLAKNRLRLPYELPLSWDAYAQYFNPSATNNS